MSPAKKKTCNLFAPLFSASPSIHDNTGKEEEGMDRGKKKMTVEELKAKIRAKKALVEAKKRKFETIV